MQFPFSEVSKKKTYVYIKQTIKKCEEKTKKERRKIEEKGGKNKNDTF